MKKLIDRYKSLRTRRQLRLGTSGEFAFVGIGSHARQNLYPVLQHLGVPLRYICCRGGGSHGRKLSLIEARYGVQATTDLGQVLDDPQVRGVLVCTGPDSHFDIARRVLESGKSLFVEKPPCRTLRQLSELVSIADARPVRSCDCLVGMQKRYAPAVRILRHRLDRCRPVSYRMTYAMGAFPEGDPLLELFIHPLDLLCHLFGEPEVVGVSTLQRNRGELTLQLLLRHGAISGLAELSTRHSWTGAFEHLSVNSTQGAFELHNLERLTFSPHLRTLLRIPLEKLRPSIPALHTLYACNGVLPTVPNNQLVTAGFCDELRTFVALADGRSSTNLSPLTSLLSTYRLLDALRI